MPMVPGMPMERGRRGPLVEVRNAPWQFLRGTQESSVGYEAIWAATVLEKVVSRV